MAFPPCVKRAAKKSGISKRKLQQSYDRGIGAWKTNPSSVRNLKGRKGGPGKRLPKQQWACARVNKLARLKLRAGYDQDLLKGRGNAKGFTLVTIGGKKVKSMKSGTPLTMRRWRATKSS